MFVSCWKKKKEDIEVLGFLRLAFIAVKFKMIHSANRFGFEVIVSSNQHVHFPIWMLWSGESRFEPDCTSSWEAFPTSTPEAHPSDMNRQNTRRNKCYVTEFSFDELLNKHRRAEILNRLQLLFWTISWTKGWVFCLKALTARFVKKRKKNGNGRTDGTVKSIRPELTAAVFTCTAEDDTNDKQCLCLELIDWFLQNVKKKEIPWREINCV